MSSKKKRPQEQSIPPQPSRASSALDNVFGTNRWRKELDNETAFEAWPHISTGVAAIDALLGGSPNHNGVIICPGIPKSRMSSVEGPGSLGKMTLTLQVAANVLKEGGKVIFLHDTPRDYAEQLGIPAPSMGTPIIWADMKPSVDAIVAGIKQTPMLMVLPPKGKSALQAMIVALAVADLIVVAPDDLGVDHNQWSEFLPLLRDRMRKSGHSVLFTYQDEPRFQSQRVYLDLRLRLTPLTPENMQISVVKNKASDSHGWQTLVGFRDGVGFVPCENSQDIG